MSVYNFEKLFISKARPVSLSISVCVFCDFGGALCFITAYLGWQWCVRGMKGPKVNEVN